MTKTSDEESWGGSFEETRRRQRLLGLELTPVERLRWLDARLAEVRRLREAMEKATSGGDTEE